MQRQPEPELMDLPEEAKAYARAKFPDVMESIVARLSELAAGREDARMVDLGTGPGTIPVMVAKAHPTWHITAVDAAKAMLTIAGVSIKMAGVAERVKLELADVKSTGLADHGFDIVFCSSVVHHMPDPLPLWREIRRLAAPGALIFVRDLRRPESEQAAREIMLKHASQESQLLQEEFYRSLLSAFTVEEVRKQLEAAGLSNLKVEALADRYLDVYGVMGRAAS
jgi:ubiquinone/menaquinone biosynthesis C-methylase UbiE